MYLFHKPYYSLQTAILQSFTSNPCDEQLMRTVKSCDIIRGASLYADSFLDLNEGSFAFNV